MNLTKQDYSTLWVASFRYYLGRMTDATHDFGSMLKYNWESLDGNTQYIIIKELREAVQRDDDDRARGVEYKHLGMTMDSNMWRELLIKLSQN